MRDLAPRRPPHSPLRWLLAALAVAWLAAVLAIELTGLRPSEIASSPDWLLDGRFPRLLSSSLVIEDDLPLLQLALLAAATALVLVRDGAVIWWLAALAGHVGSALIAYGVLGIAIALGSGSADRAADDLDYGISCVLAAQLGVLFSGSVRRTRGGRGGPLDVALIAATACALIFWFATLDWFGIEHQLAFLLGIAVALAGGRVGAARQPVG